MVAVGPREVVRVGVPDERDFAATGRPDGVVATYSALSVQEGGG